MKQITDMTDGGITRQILRFAFPLILANIGQQIYMIVDASIVGLGVGVKALAAVGATDWCYSLFLWTVISFTQGFATFVSHHFGEGNYRKLNQTVWTSILLCASIGVLLTVVGLFTAKPLLMWLGTPADILADATVYLVTMISGSLVITAYNMASSILRALGDGRSPLWAMVIAAVLNVALDLLFVLGFDMSVFGAALASVISQCVAFLYCFLRIRKISFVKLEKESRVLSWQMIRKMLGFGIPLALEYIVISLGGVVLQSTINTQGSVFIAGYTATFKLYGLLEASGMSLGLAIATFVSQNYGARKYTRIRKGIRCGALLAVLAAVLVGSFMAISGRLLLRLFLDTKDKDALAALDVGYKFLLVLAAGTIILYLLHVYRNVLQGVEIAFWSMLSGGTEGIVRIFMAKVMVQHMGTDALLHAEPWAWLGALLTVLIPCLYYRKKIWSQKTSDT